VFSLGPVVAGLGLSFTTWNLLRPPVFARAANYVALLTEDPLFLLSLRNTLYYSVLSIPLSIAVSLALALLLNQEIRGVKAYRTVYFIPAVVSMVAVSLVWKWMYSKDFGILNGILDVVGLPPVGWLGSADTAMPSIVIMVVWKNMGYDMVIFLAGLQAIPQHLYDAAKVDGAGRWRRFWHITLPLLSPTMFFIVVLNIIASFQVFGPVYLMTEGGPGNRTLVYNYYLYQNAFLYLKMGYASAMAYILFAIIFIVTLIQTRYLGRRVIYEMG
jgi:ABC-type sugar transport system permease subunit